MKTEPSQKANDPMFGLTKREMIAALSMAGYSASYQHSINEPETRAKWAVEDADSLINELNKSKQ